VSGFLFNDYLEKLEISPSDVRLLRHQENNESRRSSYSLWVESAEKFNRYQQIQATSQRSKFAADYWASFVVTPDAKTLFVGLFKTQFVCQKPQDYYYPFDEKILSQEHALIVDQYSCTLLPESEILVGKLIVDWGPGTRSWVQKANSDAGVNKPIIEIREKFSEPDFPGFQNFIITLANIPKMPSTWNAILSSSYGIYLLTCPKTKEQYVGQAYGENGFLGRWLQYARDGHGGNIGLKSRNREDYQVSILEVCGSSTTKAEIDALESLWKRKLQSREMGLNRN
jgi:hypothetical protein